MKLSYNAEKEQRGGTYRPLARGWSPMRGSLLQTLPPHTALPKAFISWVLDIPRSQQRDQGPAWGASYSAAFPEMFLGTLGSAFSPYVEGYSEIGVHPLFRSLGRKTLPFVMHVNYDCPHLEAGTRIKRGPHRRCSPSPQVATGTGYRTAAKSLV